MNKVVWILAVPLVAGAWFLGFRQGQAGGSGDLPLGVVSRPGTPVATFGGESISAEELKAQIEEQTPFVRARYASPEGKKEFLEGIVRFELLAQEAQKKGYHRDPEVLRQFKKNMVSFFVQKEFEEAQHKLPISDDELKKFYDDHIEDYVKPERVRIAHIFIDAPASDPALRAKKRAAAEAALDEVREKDARDVNAFGHIVRLRSEDQQSRPVHGDLAYKSREELTARVGAEVAEVAFSMRELNTFHDGIIETPQGYHIIKLLGRENALNLSFTDVRESIRTRLVYERRAKNYNDFIAELQKKAGLTIDEKVLESLKIDLGAPTPTKPLGMAPPPAPAARAEPVPAVAAEQDKVAVPAVDSQPDDQKPAVAK